MLSFPNQKSGVFNTDCLAVLLALNIGRAAAWQTCNFWQSGVGDRSNLCLTSAEHQSSSNQLPSIDPVFLYTTIRIIRLYLRIENPSETKKKTHSILQKRMFHMKWPQMGGQIPHPFVDKPVPQVLASHQPIFRARPELKET